MTERGPQKLCSIEQCSSWGRNLEEIYGRVWWEWSRRLGQTDLLLHPCRAGPFQLSSPAPNSMAPNRAWAKVMLHKGITDHQTQSRLSERYVGKFRNQKTARATTGQSKMAAYNRCQQEEVRDQEADWQWGLSDTEQAFPWPSGGPSYPKLTKCIWESGHRDRDRRRKGKKWYLRLHQ